MFLFGHAGITLGAAALLANTFPKCCFSKTAGNEATEASSRSSKVTRTLSNLPGYKASWFASLGNCIDIRLLLIGSLLPDIIDKPIGTLLFRETFSSGRIFFHTLFTAILITLAGLYIYKRNRKTSLLAISFGTFTHLIFDQMWRTPRTLFWPIYGMAFDRADITDWIWNLLHVVGTDPQYYIPELVGAAILVWFTVVLVRKQKIVYFLKCGREQ